MKYAVKLVEAFQFVDNGPSKAVTRSKERSIHQVLKCSASSNKSGDRDSKLNNKNVKRTKKEVPRCFYAPRHSKELQDWLNDCTACPKNETPKVWAAHAAKLAKNKYSKSTSGQQAERDAYYADKKSLPGTIGRLNHEVKTKNNSSMYQTASITFTNGHASLDCTGCCDDGGKDSLVYLKVAEAAVLKGIWKLIAIEPVRLKAAFCKSKNAATFTFSRV